MACDSGVLGCIFSSGASSAVLGFSSGVLGFSSGAFGCIFSSWALALGSWALALGSRAISLAQGLFLSPCSLNRSGALVALRSWALAVRSWPLGLGALALVQRHRIRFLALQLLDEGSCFSSGVLGLGLSSGVLRFSSGVLGFSLGSWALALGSWASTLGFRLWGLRLFSSGASALSLL